MNTPSHDIHEVMDDSKIIPIAYTSGDDDFKGSVNLYDTTSEANLLSAENSGAENGCTSKVETEGMATTRPNDKVNGFNHTR